MCIGTPMQVIAVAAGRAVCEGRGERCELDCALIAMPEPGAWVLSFRGAAMRVMTPQEAAQANGALDALAAVLAGQPLSEACFADLTEREPELPPHLRRVAQ